MVIHHLSCSYFLSGGMGWDYRDRNHQESEGCDLLIHLLRHQASFCTSSVYVVHDHLDIEGSTTCTENFFVLTLTLKPSSFATILGGVS